MADLINGEVPVGWKFTTLGAICQSGGGSIQTGPFGSQLHASDYVSVGIPSVMPVNIGDNRIVEDGIMRITEADATRLSRHRLQVGDIVYSRRGDVERRALVRKPQEGWLCGTGCLKVRLGNGIVDPLFASLYLGHPAVRQWIVQHAVGAKMPNLNTEIMSAIPFALPPLTEQKRIAHILGTLDDKIELNRRMNATLEGISRAIFKSWFVDFDPVRQKAAGQQPVGIDAQTVALFPDSFEDSEIGEVPKGWATCTLDDYTQVVIGGDWGTSEPSATSESRCLCIRGADIPSLQNGGIGKLPLRYLKSSSLEKRRLAPWDLVIEISGGSPTQSTGRPVLVTQGLVERLRLPVIASNFCRIVKLKDAEQAPFVYFWLRHLYDADTFLQYENGTTGIKNFAYTLFAARHPLLSPDSRILEAFCLKVSPIIGFQQQMAREADSLASLRDTLLPKLLSGEIRVPEAEQTVEEAIA